MSHCLRGFHARKVETLVLIHRTDKFRLRHCILYDHPAEDFCSLPEQECLTAFLHWTANIRPTLSGVSVRERLMCPMLWCRRDTFIDVTSVIEHVNSCSWLPNSWYWCPQCSRPERFVGCSGMHVTGQSYTLPTKESKLRKAVAFFKHLGRGSSVRERNASTRPHLELETDGWSGRSPYKKCEMSDTSSIFSPGLTEIDDNEVYEIHRRTQVFEMSTPHTRTSLTEEGHGIPIELDSAYFRSELCGSLPSHTELSCSRHSESFASHNVSDLHEKETSVCAAPSYDDTFESMSWRNLSHDAYERQLIEELRDLFCVVKSEWEMRLVMPSIYSRFDAAGLFEMGIETLKRWSEGMAPESFEGVFALMHLACACAYLLHPDDQPLYWDDFFEDMLHWQQAIPNREEKLVFRRVVKELYYYQGSSKAAFESACQLDMDGTDGLLRVLSHGRIIQECLDFLSRRII